jgi:5'-3' exonuclease
MKKIYILDGYNLIYRMFFAIKGVSLSDGSPINAVFGIAKLLHQFATRDKPDELYFVIDPPG